MRKTPFVEGEYYHVYNRGVEKRNLFNDNRDFRRFNDSLKLFNTTANIESVDHLAFKNRLSSLATQPPLVEFVAFCINPNHFHFLLTQIADRGIERFMHRLGSGYTRYFNERHKRSGGLFQGTFKAIHIESNGYQLYLSAYINLNWKVHKLSSLATQFVSSSWDEYAIEGNEDKSEKEMCNKKIITDQFEDRKDYIKFAEESLKQIREHKDELAAIEFDERELRTKTFRQNKNREN